MRAARLYPFLLSAVPVLHIVADNPGESSLLDLLLVLAATIGLAGVVYFLGARLPREPDAQYLSLERAPYDFRGVDPSWLAPRRKLHHGFIGSSSTSR